MEGSIFLLTSILSVLFREKTSICFHHLFNILRFDLLHRPSKRLWYTNHQNITYLNCTDTTKIQRIQVIIWLKQVQRHTCHVAIQLWSWRFNDDAFFQLDKVWILFVSNDREIFTCDFLHSTTAWLHVLEGCVDRHTSERFSSQTWHVDMLWKAFFPKSLSTANIAEVALSASITVYDTRHKRFWDFVLEREARR